MRASRPRHRYPYGLPGSRTTGRSHLSYPTLQPLSRSTAEKRSQEGMRKREMWRFELGELHITAELEAEFPEITDNFALKHNLIFKLYRLFSSVQTRYEAPFPFRLQVFEAAL